MSDITILPGAQLTLQAVSAETVLAVNVTEMRISIEVSPAEAPLVLVSEPAPVDVIEVLLGGASAPAPAPAAYDQRVAEVAEDLFYRGEAAPGADEAAPVWHICRITINAAGEPVLAWAHGGDFTCAWTDRTTYTYE